MVLKQHTSVGSVDTGVVNICLAMLLLFHMTSVQENNCPLHLPKVKIRDVVITLPSLNFFTDQEVYSTLLT